jgi:hypothetical protein
MPAPRPCEAPVMRATFWYWVFMMTFSGEWMISSDQ